MAKVKITETVLRDSHQSLVATRMTTEDMLPILADLDKVGYHSLEAWGGATFDSCLRFLNEDPWERLTTLKSHLKNTPIQMLLRGQNLLGYKHYSDDVVEKFVEYCIKNGVKVIRVFDALNDVRNLETAMKAIKKYGAVSIKSTDQKKASVELLQSRLKSLDTQIYYLRKLSALHAILSVPEATQNGTISNAETGKAVLTGQGFTSASVRVETEENAFKKCDRNALKVILKICRNSKDSGIKELKVSDIDIKLLLK